MPTSTIASQNASLDTPRVTDKKAMSIVTTLFFMWGFLTALNDILIPHFKPIFDLNYTRSMLIQFSFFSAYFLFAVPSGYLIEWVGYKWAMVSGLFTMGLGAFLFIPAASVASYPMFLTALMVLAAGMTILQVSANPYVAIIGPPATASSRLNLTQAFNSLGTTIAPYLGGLFILTALPTADAIRHFSAPELQAFRVEQASSVKMPYLSLGLILVALGVAIALYKFPVIASALHHKGEVTHSIWRYRHTVLAAVGIFVYCGAEVSLGSFMVNYFSQADIGNISEKVAAGYVSFYGASAMVGRFIGSALLQKLRSGTVLGFAGIAAFLLICLSMVTFGPFAMWSLLMVGLFNSVVFPGIFTLGIAQLGPLTSKGSSMIVMAILGAAIIPVLVGALADRIGVHHAFILPAVCYLYVVYYGFAGSKPMGPGITEEA
jgi:FHS family L-fucose permease-like MFS transporter